MNPAATNDINVLQDWVGRTESRVDVIRAPWAQMMQQTLDRAGELVDGDVLPQLWHWIYFLDSVPLARVGADGHPERGGFLPPVALPRRMWAGGRLTFGEPIRLGDTVTKTSTINNVVMKEGSTGALCFVTVTHELHVNNKLCVSEEQDLVYREHPDPDAPKREPKPARTDAIWSETVTPCEVMLFRFSALTFNGHRIHYDRPYATDVEGYPGLVFHGPLTATLLGGLATSSSGQPMTSFSFRAMAPLFDMDPFTISGAPSPEGDHSVDLWATAPGGGLAMQASATFPD